MGAISQSNTCFSNSGIMEVLNIVRKREAMKSAEMSLCTECLDNTSSLSAYVASEIGRIDLLWVRILDAHIVLRRVIGHVSRLLWCKSIQIQIAPNACDQSIDPMFPAFWHYGNAEFSIQRSSHERCRDESVLKSSRQWIISIGTC